MGTYLNPGRRGFENAVGSEIYVDKTGMLAYLNTLVNTSQRYVSVSRPRRFGKTMAADMACAYFGRDAGARGLFEGTLLAATPPVRTARGELAWDAYLGAFDVVRLVMTDFIKTQMSVAESLARMQCLVARELVHLFPDVDYFDRDDLVQSFQDVYSSTGAQFVIVVDEWDAVFRERQADAKGQSAFLDFLRDLLKDKPYVALAYMTGILPIKKLARQSSLNMFEECSMAQPMGLARYTGFTEGEVRELCQRYEMDYDDVSSWYDGYLLHDNVPVGKRRLFREGGLQEHGMHVYNPLSVVTAMRRGTVGYYWNNVESYEALSCYVLYDLPGLRSAVEQLMSGDRVAIDTSTYQNDMCTFRFRDDVLMLLVHLGYLGYDASTGEAFIPNRETLEAFRRATGEYAACAAEVPMTFVKDAS